MIREDNIQQVVDMLRRIGTDTQSVEVKAAFEKTPTKLAQTISAFANAQGGSIILGLDEQANFTSSKRFNAQARADAIATICNTQLTPPIYPNIEILPFESHFVTVATIPPLRPFDKPCYVTNKGKYNGSFYRTHDGDRRLSQYEIDRLIEEKTQPEHDIEPVTQATLDDLDATAIEEFIFHQKKSKPRMLAKLSNEQILFNLRVITKIADGDSKPTFCPTLAGLLTFGTYPQFYFPRLNVTFAKFPGLTKSGLVGDRRVIIDSRSFDGSIPEIIPQVVNAVEENSRMGAVIEGAFRKNLPDYPHAVVREAVTNAIAHRDYSSHGRGGQVQVNMFADRLEIQNPGGLFGSVTIDGLGNEGVSATRNQYLSRMLESTPYLTNGFVIENRGSGFRTILDTLENQHLPKPKAKDTIANFFLTFYPRQTEQQEALFKQQTEHDKPLLQNRTQQVEATPLLEQTTTAAYSPVSPKDRKQQVLAAILQSGSLSASELRSVTGFAATTLQRTLNQLIEDNLITRTAPIRSPRLRYKATKDASKP